MRKETTAKIEKGENEEKFGNDEGRNMHEMGKLG